MVERQLNTHEIHWQTHSDDLRNATQLTSRMPMRATEVGGQEDVYLSVPESREMSLTQLLNLPNDTLGFAEQSVMYVLSVSSSIFVNFSQ